MNIIKILGVDPSLRNTGLAIVSYDSELSPNDPKAFSTEGCQVLTNPIKFKGTDAILNMIDMMFEQSQKIEYQCVDNVLIESPSIMFNKTWAGGAISSIAHISGAAVPIFGISKSLLFRPNEWNKTRKKDVTHSNTVSYLGNPEIWGYVKRVKSEKFMEHILDAASMALWYLKCNYLEE